MNQLTQCLDKQSEAVLRLLEGGKRRGLEELRKGKGRGSQKELFAMVSATEHAFLELHKRCGTAVRFSRRDTATDTALDIQYLLFHFSRQVYDMAFSTKEVDPASISFPPPEAYSRHYPGSGPEDKETYTAFKQYFGETVYLTVKSNLHQGAEIDLARKDRILQLLKQPN